MNRTPVSRILDSLWSIRTYTTCCSAILLGICSILLSWGNILLWPRFLDIFLVGILISVLYVSRFCAWITLLGSLLPCVYVLPPAHSFAVEISWQVIFMLVFYLAVALLLIALVPQGGISETIAASTKTSGGFWIAFGVLYFAAASAALFWLTPRGLRPMRFMDLYLIAVLLETRFASRAYAIAMYLVSIIPALYFAPLDHSWAMNPGFNIVRVVSYSSVALLIAFWVPSRRRSGPSELILVALPTDAGLLD